MSNTLTVLWSIRDLVDPRVLVSHKAILFTLAALRERRGGVFVIRASVAQIAAGAGVARATATRILGQLVAWGFVARVPGNHHEVTEYTLAALDGRPSETPRAEVPETPHAEAPRANEAPHLRQGDTSPAPLRHLTVRPHSISEDHTEDRERSESAHASTRENEPEKITIGSPMPAWAVTAFETVEAPSGIRFDRPRVWGRYVAIRCDDSRAKRPISYADFSGWLWSEKPKAETERDRARTSGRPNGPARQPPNDDADAPWRTPQIPNLVAVK